jgi:hypothetical protein
MKPATKALASVALPDMAPDGICFPLGRIGKASMP